MVAGDVAYLVKFLRCIHEAPNVTPKPHKLGMVAHASDVSTQTVKVGGEVQMFRVILSYTESLASVG